jgi:rhamnose transport system permease protein
MSPYFWNPANILDRSRHFVEIGIMATTMTFIIMTAGIDLSVASILAFCGIVFGFSWQYLGENLLLAAFLALLTGTLCGAFQGWIIAWWNIPPLLVTLAGLALFRGMAYAIARDQYVSNFPAVYRALGQNYLGDFPFQLIPFILIFLIMAILLQMTILGRQTILIGENETAAIYAGIPVKRVKLLLYSLSGLMSAIAALIYTARVNTAKPDAAEGYELDVITCVVLGGTRITGGSGSIFGTFMGLLILGMLRYGLELAGISSAWITLLVGLLLITTAIINERFSS